MCGMLPVTFFALAILIHINFYQSFYPDITRMVNVPSSLLLQMTESWEGPGNEANTNG